MTPAQAHDFVITAVAQDWHHRPELFGPLLFLYIILGFASSLITMINVDGSRWYKSNDQLTDNTIALAGALGGLFWPLILVGFVLYGLRYVYVPFGMLFGGVGEVWSVVFPKKVKVPAAKVVRRP